MSSKYESLLDLSIGSGKRVVDSKRPPRKPLSCATSATIKSITSLKKIDASAITKDIGKSLVALRVGKRAERLSAARTLGTIVFENEIRVPEAVLPLTVTLASDRDESVRKEAAWSLWKLGDGRAHRPLIKALVGDPSVGVRARAARALGFMGVKDSLPVMLDLLRLGRHVSAKLRSAIAASLGYLADEEAIEALLATSDDADPEVRCEAVRSLGRYLVGFSDEVNDLAFKRLRKALQPRSESQAVIRRAAIKGFRLSPSEQAGVVVAKALGQDPDPETRQVAADALALWNSRDVEAALVAALSDDYLSVRRAAARSLSRFVVRYGIYNNAAVCEALTRIQRMFSSYSTECRLASEALASL
jgi:HEAT repeat protein